MSMNNVSFRVTLLQSCQLFLLLLSPPSDEAAASSSPSLLFAMVSTLLFSLSMRRSEMTTKSEVCDICGVHGFKECLVLCNICKERMEHMYCVITTDDPNPNVNNWICGICKTDGNGTSARLLGQVRESELKTITEEDRHMPDKYKETRTSPAAADGSRQVTCRNVLKIRVTEQTSIKKSSENHELPFLLPSKPVTFNWNDRQAHRKRPKGASPLTASNRPQAVVSGSPPVYTNNLSSFQNLGKACLESATWSGSFIITAAASSSICKGIRAHCSKTADSESLKLAGSLPAMLACEKQKWREAWSRCSPRSSPSLGIVDLVFLPMDMNSHDSSFKRLIDEVTANDLSLIAELGSMQLLMSSSGHFSSRAEQFWNGRHYLWGVFKKTKIDAVKNFQNASQSDVDHRVNTAMKKNDNVEPPLPAGFFPSPNPPPLPAGFFPSPNPPPLPSGSSPNQPSPNSPPPLLDLSASEPIPNPPPLPPDPPSSQPSPNQPPLPPDSPSTQPSPNPPPLPPDSPSSQPSPNSPSLPPDSPSSQRCPNPTPLPPSSPPTQSSSNPTPLPPGSPPTQSCPNPPPLPPSSPPTQPSTPSSDKSWEDLQAALTFNSASASSVKDTVLVPCPVQQDGSCDRSVESVSSAASVAVQQKGNEFGTKRTTTSAGVDKLNECQGTKKRRKRSFMSGNVGVTSSMKIPIQRDILSFLLETSELVKQTVPLANKQTVSTQISDPVKAQLEGKTKSNVMPDLNKPAIPDLNQPPECNISSTETQLGEVKNDGQRGFELVSNGLCSPGNEDKRKNDDLNSPAECDISSTNTQLSEVQATGLRGILKRRPNISMHSTQAEKTSGSIDCNADSNANVAKEYDEVFRDMTQKRVKFGETDGDVEKKKNVNYRPQDAPISSSGKFHVGINRDDTVNPMVCLPLFPIADQSMKIDDTTGILVDLCGPNGLHLDQGLPLVEQLDRFCYSPYSGVIPTGIGGVSLELILALPRYRKQGNTWVAGRDAETGHEDVELTMEIMDECTICM